MLKKKLFLVLVAFLPSYSYSDSIAIYPGQTGNAAANGNTWDMNNVFPTGIPGLDVNTIIYDYSVNKETEDVSSAPELILKPSTS